LEQLLQRHSGPILFAGDFNTWSQSRHRLVTSAAARLGLTSAFFADDSQKIKRFLFSPPLDYIFYKGLAERWGKTCVLGGVTSSDHKPLLAEFCWEAT
jgi:endonuclease/exonuclease/phosphatase (EEP) superfamily protein YafD